MRFTHTDLRLTLFTVAGLAFIVMVAMIVTVFRQRPGEPPYIPKHSTNPGHQAHWRSAGTPLAIEGPRQAGPGEDGEVPFTMFHDCHLDR